MCRLLQVLQPFLDFVWLFRGGPPPGPAISIGQNLRRVKLEAKNQADGKAVDKGSGGKQ